ncbi:F-box only protein 38-like [Centruroides vittatus]|uniref:F-box only protein 38-like n=1 Tax=Centruroides vittatus TaxID=120091 RepID=UPI0035108C30
MYLISDLNLTSLSNELLCHIISFLPLKDILHVAVLCKKLNNAVYMYLHLCKILHLTDSNLFEYMPNSITDENLRNLFKKCCHLKIIYGLHSRRIEHRRIRRQAKLTVQGIISALQQCTHLKAVEISNVFLMENILRSLPQVNIIGHFRNHDSTFPQMCPYKLKLPSYSNISSLYLTGVKVMELTLLPQLEHLYLQWITFVKPHPFQLFGAPNLKTFVMRHTTGPDINLRYLPLIVALSASTALERLELIRVPIIGGMIKRAVENSWQNGGFCRLRTLIISGCRDILEADIGNLIIVASRHLEHLALQPSLTKNSLFVSLSFAQCCFSNLKSLQLGYIDELPSEGDWSEEMLEGIGLTESTDLPCLITDTGMKVISQIFPNLKSLSINNCIHVTTPHLWCPEGTLPWKHLSDLIVRHCTHLHLSSFIHFIENLSSIETLILEDVFREAPNTYDHVCCKEHVVHDDLLEKQREGNFEDLQNTRVDLCDNIQKTPKSDYNEVQNIKRQSKKRKLNNSDENIYHASTSGVNSSEEHIKSDAKNKHGTEEKSNSCAFNKRQCKYNPDNSLDIPYDPSNMTERNSNKRYLRSESSQTTDSFIRQCFPPSHCRKVHNCMMCSSDYISEANIIQSNEEIINVDKSTDTCDLILLTNCNQVFYLSSKTLVSISIVTCGMTDIIIDYSPNLLHIEVSACRILKRIKMIICPILIRIGITKCPKLNLSFLADNIFCIPSPFGRIVYFEPFEKSYDQKKTEKLLFNNENCGFYVYLLHDFSPNGDRAVYRESFLNWIQLFSKINRKLFESGRFELNTQWTQQSTSYPWGNDFSYVNGSFSNGKYNILTNNPFLKELWWLSQESSHELNDFPDSSLHEVSKIEEVLIEKIAELKEMKRILFSNNVGFYVHVKDKNL